MTQYTCGNFTVSLLHYGNKKVFLRDNAGEEFTVQRDFFDENYTADKIDYESLIRDTSRAIKRNV